jgi:hypothetical protein
MVLKLPDQYISLFLLMPLDTLFDKVDLGTQVFIPSPVALFHRYYHMFTANSNSGMTQDLAFAHLRG